MYLGRHVDRYACQGVSAEMFDYSVRSTMGEPRFLSLYHTRPVASRRVNVISSRASNTGISRNPTRYYTVGSISQLPVL